MRVAVLISACVLVACATPYRPPTERAPPHWYGSAGLTAADGAAPRIIAGDMGEGGLIASIDVDHVRTARIVNEITYRSPFGSTVVIAAGAPARAEQLSLMVSYGYSGTSTNMNAQNDPIEWCTTAVDGRAVCIFWEAPDRARYIDTYIESAPRVVVPYSAAGMVGPMPEIVEEDVDLGPPLQMQLVIADWDRRRVRLSLQISEDGVVGRREWLHAPWGRATLSAHFGAVYRLTPIGDADNPTAVRVEILRRPPNARTVDAI